MFVYRRLHVIPDGLVLCNGTFEGTVRHRYQGVDLLVSHQGPDADAGLDQRDGRQRHDELNE